MSFNLPLKGDHVLSDIRYYPQAASLYQLQRKLERAERKGGKAKRQKQLVSKVINQALGN